MRIFGGKKEEEDYDEDDDSSLDETLEDEGKRDFRKIRDLKPEYKKRRKEPPKPWGKTERLIVLLVIVTTILLSAIASFSSRDWKLPGIPRITFSVPSFS